MAKTSVSSEEERLKAERAEKRRRLLDMLEPRIMTLLIFAPPTLGVVLGGVAVSTFRRFAGLELPRIPGDYVTLGLGIFCALGLSVIGLFVRNAWLGKPTRFPRLMRVAPFSALAGLVFGTTIASLKAAGIIH